ncbi:hypothetical protein [Aeromonas sp. s5]|uniref:hypothetical protein n=1 Tax=Aeromonas sp. s5 TaxID=3138487 RepID=UPI0034A23264
MNKRILGKNHDGVERQRPWSGASTIEGSMNLEAAFWLLVNVMAAIYGAFVAGLFTGLFLVN